MRRVLIGCAAIRQLTYMSSRLSTSSCQYPYCLFVSQFNQMWSFDKNLLNWHIQIYVFFCIFRYIQHLMDALESETPQSIEEFKADLSRKTPCRAEKRKCIEAEIVSWVIYKGYCWVDGRLFIWRFLLVFQFLSPRCQIAMQMSPNLLITSGVDGNSLWWWEFWVVILRVPYVIDSSPTFILHNRDTTYSLPEICPSSFSHLGYGYPHVVRILCKQRDCSHNYYGRWIIIRGPLM